MDKKELLNMLTRKIRLDEIYQDAYCETIADLFLDVPAKYIYTIDKSFYNMVYIEKDKGIIVPFCSGSDFERTKHNINFYKDVYNKYLNEKNYKEVFYLICSEYKQFGMMLFDLLKDVIPEEQKQECLDIAINGANTDDCLDRLYGSK